MITPESLAASGSEDGHQAAVFCYFQLQRIKYPATKWLYATPNGGKRDIKSAARLKATGVKSGVPDLFLPIRRGLFSGLWIELKKDHKQKASKEQLIWIDMLRCQGYAALVCVGWIEAKQVIECYLDHGRIPFGVSMREL